MQSIRTLSIPRTAVTLLALALPVVPAFAAGHDEALPNFHKVNDQVYRGGQPLPEGFKTLAGLGVKTVVDLREIGEHSQAEEQRLVEAEGMRYVSVPMQGMSAPTQDQITRVLGLLNDNGAGPVFVHCRRGADRTGTIIAAYRIGHDRWENKKALSEARSLGMSWFEKAMQHYVMAYAAAPAAAAVVEAVATPLAHGVATAATP